MARLGSAAIADFGELLRRDGAVLARRIASVPTPQGEAQRGQRGPEQGAAPSEKVHERGDQRRRDGRPELQSHRLQTDHRSPAVGRKPLLEDAGGDGIGGRLRHAEQHLQRQETANSVVPVNSDGASGVAIMAVTAASPISTRALAGAPALRKDADGIWNTA